MSKELLKQYREIKATDKAICFVYLEVHKDEDGELYASENNSWVLGLVNTDESLLDEFLESYSGLLEEFGITDTGDYTFECVLNLVPEQRSFAPPVQPDFHKYYELEYYEATNE